MNPAVRLTVVERRRAFDPFSLVDSRTYAWDASDTASITKNGSDQVSQLADITGNGCHLQMSTDAAKPLDSGVTINGLRALDCRTDKHMTPAFPFFPAANACEVFFVGWSDRAATADNTYLLARPSGSTTARNIYAAKTQFGGTTLSGSVVTRSNRTMRCSFIQHSYTEGSTGTITQYMAIDGRLISGSVTCTNVGGVGSSAFGQTDGSIPFNGLFGEAWVFNRVLTASQRANMITYLTNKWRALTPVAKYHVVLIAGQSNARGAWGPVNLTDDATDPRIAMLERSYTLGTGVVREDATGELVLAEHPLSNRWRDVSTPPPEDSVGPGLAYAKALLATLPADEGVLLVPCAQGGTFVMTQPPLSNDVTWAPSPTGGRSNAPYTDAIARMNRVLALGHELHSIIWCQGENEAAQATMSEATYRGYLDATLNGLRASITGATSTPIVLMQIGSFLDGGTYPNAANVNAAIADTPNRLANTAVVLNTGYTDGGDSLHYDATSQRLIGAAMYAAYETI